MTDRELLESIIMDKTLLQEMAKDIRGLKEDVAELKADVAELKANVAELKADVADLKGRVEILEEKVEHLENDNRVIKVTLENEIKSKIGFIADGYVDLNRKMDILFEEREKVEDLSLRVIKLEIDVGKIKEDIGKGKRKKEKQFV